MSKKLINNKSQKYEPYQELANAIIIQAAEDYRKALKYDGKGMQKECAKFFRSEWFRLLTNLDGELLMKKIKAEVQ